jgi:hypothetical protein
MFNSLLDWFTGNVFKPAFWGLHLQAAALLD